MREEKILVRVLRQLAGLIEQEAENNQAFAEKLEAILAPLPRRSTARPSRIEVSAGDLPDVFAERKTRGEREFEFWLRDLGSPMLRALIKHHGLDPSKRSQKWNDSEKLAHLVSEQLQARLSRGASFLKPSDQSPPAAVSPKDAP